MYGLALKLVAVAVYDISGAHLVNHLSRKTISLPLANTVCLRMKLVIRI